ncbi:MAG: 3-hydroxyacyl-ACP dehydratase [Bacteroidia bacterium]|nr:3-hydroxyacyl-ACP dehydratase [Bacteroidia bacterium]
MSTTLLDNFYKETSSTFSETNQENFISEIAINPEHPVFKGHFEQVPIAPGVCLIQVIKEILAEKFKKELFMSHGDNIKFLAMINPRETTNLSISFSVKQSEGFLDVTASYTHAGISYVKFKGKFKVLN